MRYLKHLVSPFPWTKWNVSTFAVAMGAIVTAAHFFLTPIVGVPEPASFFLAYAVLVPLWSTLVRREAEGRV